MGPLFSALESIETYNNLKQLKHAYEENIEFESFEAEDSQFIISSKYILTVWDLNTSLINLGTIIRV